MASKYEDFFEIARTRPRKVTDSQKKSLEKTKIKKELKLNKLKGQKIQERIEKGLSPFTESYKGKKSAAEKFKDRYGK